MRERPILFNGEMVRAIFDDRKTQTRRVAKDFPEPWERFYAELGCCESDWHLAPDDDGVWWWSSNAAPCEEVGRCPYGQPGDRLWVRETWAPVRDGASAIYRADKLTQTAGYAHVIRNGGRWRPSIHMPRWASRITLEVTGVRVERVQNISEADARAEGVAPLRGKGLISINGEPCGDSVIIHPVLCFKALWDTINAKRGYSWEKNPWVWVVEFRVLP